MSRGRCRRQVRCCRAHPLLDQWHEGLAAIGREVQSIERGGQDFRRGRLEIEEQTDRLRQIHVGEVAQHFAVGIAVEQTGQNRALQQVVASIRGRGSAPARASLPNMTCASRGSSAENNRVTSVYFRSSAVCFASGPLRSSSVSRTSIVAMSAGSSTSTTRSRSETWDSPCAESVRTQPRSGGYR